MSDEKNEENTAENLVCFAIMPIGDPAGYAAGHFKHIFDDIVAPACAKAGYRALRGDQVRQTNLIHLDILQKLIESPMAVCDLSNHNPNVLFELGLRQAFDKPVVLIRETGTPDIFDIGPLRYTEYRRERVYHEVLEDQERIANAIAATRGAFENGNGINSIVRLLALTQPARLSDVQGTDRDPLLQLIREEISSLRSEFKAALRVSAPSVDPQTVYAMSRPTRVADFSDNPELKIFLIEFAYLQGQLMNVESKIREMEQSGTINHPDALEAINGAKLKLVTMREVFRDNAVLLESIHELMQQYDSAAVRYLSVVENLS